jgi:hypothetical protein
VNPPEIRPRQRRLATVAICASALIAAACASGHTGNPPPAAVFTVVNNTASTVSVAECHSRIRHCVNAPPARLPPRGRLSSPLSAGRPASPNLLVITGYGSRTRCLVVPAKPDRAEVTQATTGACSATTASR